MAAQTLVEKGLNVTMLDVGIKQGKSVADIPDEDFLTLRKTDIEQYRYLIGEDIEGVSWGKVGKGEQITPPRKHIMHDTDRYLPVNSDSFSPLESLGYGGLGIGWGLQCWEYSKSDLKRAGMDPVRMAAAYQKVADRIGISADDDDAGNYTLGSLKNYQPSPAMDRNHRYIYKKYLGKKGTLNRRGFHMGRTPLGLITQDKDGRRKYAYRDMDFYSDAEESAWRPWITVNALRGKPNFTYVDQHLVLSFKEQKGYIEVMCLRTDTHKTVTLRCRKLILGTSALGSARIALRSLGKEDTRLPILCNPYSYMPCVQPRFFGRSAESKKLGLTQLSLFFDPSRNNTKASVASLYSYQSLMLFRIVRHVPLDFKDARILMRYLMSGIVIMGIHHPDSQSPKKYLQLKKTPGTPTGDSLYIEYRLSDEEKRLNKKRERSFIKAMRKMGTFSLKRLDPGNGSSIHYAGTLPYSTKERLFTLHPSGRLHGTMRVYVADSSGFKYLPAPGLTFSLMANAHIVAENSSRG
jgi:hypothetical protein